MMNNGQPSTSAGNGRTAAGRFGAGNAFGRGNPNNAKVQRLRNAYIKAVSRADMAAIARKVVEQAKAGDVTAAREVCDRILGKPVPSDMAERLEQLEAAIGRLAEREAAP